MKNIKNIVIGIFAVVGFAAIVTGFTNEAEQQVIHTSPESHVWEALADNGESSGAIMWNKVTGEIRKISGSYPIAKDVGIELGTIEQTYIELYKVDTEIQIK